jgi:hypothetical protein
MSGGQGRRDEGEVTNGGELFRRGKRGQTSMWEGKVFKIT